MCEQGGMCEVLEKDLYAVLGARPTDSTLQLKHRYQQLALQVNVAHKLSLTKMYSCITKMRLLIIKY